MASSKSLAPIIEIDLVKLLAEYHRRKHGNDGTIASAIDSAQPITTSIACFLRTNGYADTKENLNYVFRILEDLGQTNDYDKQWLDAINSPD